VSWVLRFGPVRAGAPRFDLGLSCFGAMFFGDPHAAFANVARSLAPRGRLALLAWRELPRNEWLVEIRAALAHGRDLPLPPPDAPTPFSLADPDRVRALLNGSGYDDIDFEAVDEPIEFGATVEDAFRFMQTLGIVRGLAHDLGEREGARALDALRAVVDAHHGRDGVLFGSSAWLITARRGTGTPS